MNIDGLFKENKNILDKPIPQDVWDEVLAKDEPINSEKESIEKDNEILTFLKGELKISKKSKRQGERYKMNRESIGKKNFDGLMMKLYNEGNWCNCQNIIKRTGMERIDYMLDFLDIGIKKIDRNDERILVDFKDFDKCKKRTALMIQARILELIDFLSITDKDWKEFKLYDEAAIRSKQFVNDAIGETEKKQ